MIIVNAIVETDATSLEAVRQALATMERASRAEEGCDDYTFSVELNAPNRIRITERWQSEAALTAHFSSAHMAEFQQAIGQHPPKSMDLHFYEAREISFPR